MRLLMDARGQKSWTLSLIVPSYIALTAKFLFASVLIPRIGTVPAMTGYEYATSAVALLGVWVAREYNANKNGKNGGVASGVTNPTV